MPNDVFISYAHADNEVPDGAERGWVTSLIDALRKAVREILGGEPEIWMDQALLPNEIVSESLQTLAAQSQTLVLVMSPGYLRSRWCQMELATFLETHAATKNKESVFIVETLPTDREQWHPRLRNLSQIPFWEKRFVDKVPSRYGYPIPNPRTDRPFYERVNELAHFVALRLKEVSTATPAQGDRPIVWVAEPPLEDGDLILHRESLARSLRQAGAEVLPGGVGCYPRESATAYRDAVGADMARARLLVQLFGVTPGRPLAGTAQNIASFQDQLARARDPHLLRWRSSEIDLDTITDPAWRELLRSASASSLEDLKQRVLRALRNEPAGPGGGPARVVAPARPEAALSQLTISVSATPGDARLRDKVADMLEDLDTSVLIIPDPSDSLSSSAYRAEYERVLGDSDGVVIVYGSAPPAWAMSAFQFSKKILAQSRRGIWGALVDGPAPQKLDHGIRARKELMLLDCREKALERALLEPFVATLRSAGSAGVSRA
jgi:hypothetical protein